MANGLDALMAQLGGAPQGAPAQGAPAPGGMPPGGMPGTAPYDPSQADPMEQAVWSAFPGTDPNAVHQLVSPAMGDPTQLSGALSSLEQLQATDREKLAAMHQEQLNALIAQLMAPEGPGMSEPAAAAPQVGGEGLGY